MIRSNVDLPFGKKTWYDNELARYQCYRRKHQAPPARRTISTSTAELKGSHGAIQYFGADFEVKSALLEIVNNQVYLQAEATSETYVSNETIPDIITMTIDRAEISKIKPRFSSKDNDSLSSEKALARATKMDPSLYEGQRRELHNAEAAYKGYRLIPHHADSAKHLGKSGLVDTFNVHYVEKTESAPTNPNQPSLASFCTERSIPLKNISLTRLSSDTRLSSTSCSGGSRLQARAGPLVQVDKKYFCDRVLPARE